MGLEKKKAAAPLKMKPATCRLTEVCGLRVCVKCVDVERHTGAAGTASPTEAPEGKRSTRGVSCWQIPANKGCLGVANSYA